MSLPHSLQTKGEHILLLLPSRQPWEAAVDGAMDAAHSLAYPYIIERHSIWNQRVNEVAPWTGAIALLREESLREQASKLTVNGALINLSNMHGPIPGVGNVLNDDIEVGRLGAAHLLGRGYASFLVLGQSNTVNSQERITGFVTAIATAGLTATVVTDAFRGGAGGDLDHYLQEIEAFLKIRLQSLPMDAGIFATSDWIARLAQGTLLRHFPERMNTTGILGVDNSRPGFYNGHVPALSSIELPFRQLGWEAAEWLLKHRRQPESAAGLMRRLPPVRVVERASTMGAVGGDPLTAQMARWAWERVRAGMWVSVAELAERHRLSRKTVARRFAQHAGLAPEEFLGRLRLDLTKDLLKNTELPISEISHRCGFAKQDVLSRAMQRAEGCTPREWRDAERKKNLPSPAPSSK